jgi:hypothetical protein
LTPVNAAQPEVGDGWRLPSKIRPSDDTMRLMRAFHPRRLRDDRLLCWFAVLVMVFQVVLATDHLGALAGRALADGTDDAGLGILTLCHGDGPIEAAAPSPDDDRPAGPANDRCVLCASPAVAGTAVAPGAPVLPPPALPSLERVAIAVVEKIPVRSPLRYGTGRGPPVSVRL